AGSAASTVSVHAAPATSTLRTLRATREPEFISVLMAIVHSHDAPEGERTIRTPPARKECLNSPTSPGADKPFSIAVPRMLRAANCDGAHSARACEALPVCRCKKACDCRRGNRDEKARAVTPSAECQTRFGERC